MSQSPPLSFNDDSIDIKLDSGRRLKEKPFSQEIAHKINTVAEFHMPNKLILFYSDTSRIPQKATLFFSVIMTFLFLNWGDFFLSQSYNSSSFQSLVKNINFRDISFAAQDYSFIDLPPHLPCSTVKEIFSYQGKNLAQMLQGLPKYNPFTPSSHTPSLLTKTFDFSLPKKQESLVENRDSLQ